MYGSGRDFIYKEISYKEISSPSAFFQIVIDILISLQGVAYLL